MTGHRLIDELLAYTRELGRIAREGGSVDERAALDERKRALLARIEQDEQEKAQAAAERLHALLCARGIVECPDYPLCGHSEADNDTHSTDTHNSDRKA